MGALPTWQTLNSYARLIWVSHLHGKAIACQLSKTMMTKRPVSQFKHSFHLRERACSRWHRLSASRAGSLPQVLSWSQGCYASAFSTSSMAFKLSTSPFSPHTSTIICLSASTLYTLAGSFLNCVSRRSSTHFSCQRLSHFPGADCQ